LFEGIAPIIPLQGNPQRLTALMDKQNIYVTKTNNHLKNVWNFLKNNWKLNN